MALNMKKFINWFRRTKPESDKIVIPADEIQTPDPLDAMSRLARGSNQHWSKTQSEFKLKTPDDFPFYEPMIDVDGPITLKGKATDAKSISKAVMDNAFKVMGGSDGAFSQYTVPEQLQNWYISQSFIGYQACAFIAQHWLVNKACSMVGKDAVRKGWEVKSSSQSELSAESSELIKHKDKEFKIDEQLVEAERFKNVFGIRILIFVVESPDKDYYEKPFNIDGVRKGGYKGISQVDPYWCMPFLTGKSTQDPASQMFYEPEYWIINGQKYHKSHLHILRNDEPADILKPTYLYGGVPLTQQIYERVYAAERTANEAPLLAMSKRTTTLRTDVAKAMANERTFAEKLMFWVKYRDNHGVKVLGKDEQVDQFDTNLSDFDSVIMNQYQLVSAIAKVPSTKLLGTSPKGFNATGEFEMVSYHEELETCQKHDLTPILDKHYLIQCKSLGIESGVKVIWEPVGSLTAKQQAEINTAKAAAGKILIDGGVISPDEERERVRDDRTSGYNRLTDEEAETQPGLNPQNMALMGKSAGEIIQGKADIEQAKADVMKSGAGFYQETGELPEGAERGELTENPAGENPIEPSEAYTDDPSIGKSQALSQLAEALVELQEHGMPEGQDVEFDAHKGMRKVKPSVDQNVKESVVNLHHTIGKMDAADLPKMKVNGHICLIENPRNSVRRGNSVDGAWANKMQHHYGFIKNTVGADGDEVDCFIGPNPKSKRVFIINQNDSHSGEFDEHKVMLGFDSAEEAKQGYDSSFNSRWDGFDSIHEVDLESFNQWIKGDCSEPYGNA